MDCTECGGSGNDPIPSRKLPCPYCKGQLPYRLPPRVVLPPYILETLKEAGL